jgi:hypothetical protein
MGLGNVTLHNRRPPSPPAQYAKRQESQTCLCFVDWNAAYGSAATSVCVLSAAVGVGAVWFAKILAGQCAAQINQLRNASRALRY